MTAISRSMTAWSPTGAERHSDEGQLDDGPHRNVEPSSRVTGDAGRGAVSFEQLDWLDEHHHAVSAMLMQRGFVPLYPQLVKASGSLKAALMLGQAIGLSRTWLQRDRSRNGWFWMGAADWQSATGLTAREQESARQALVETGLWEERRTHNPSRLYFRVRLDEVAIALGLGKQAAARGDDEAAVDDWCWDDAVATDVLGESQLFFKPLADLAGGVMAGLLLSLLLARQRAALRDRRVDVQGHFQIQYDRLADPLLIGDKAMRNARDQLRRAGFIAEQVRGSGPSARIHVGVNLAAMMACLQIQPATAMGNRVAAARLAKPKLDRQHPIMPTVAKATIAGIRQSSIAARQEQMSLIGETPSQNQAPASDLAVFSGERVNPDGALLSIAKKAITLPVHNVVALLSVADQGWCPFVESDGALLSVAYTEIEYREPPPRVRETPAVDNFDSGRRRCLDEVQHEEIQDAISEGRMQVDLIVPDGVKNLRAIAIVEAAPIALRQTLLDELAGHMRSKRKSIDSPLGFLHAITRKAIEGTLVVTMAEDVEAARTAHQAAAAREAVMLARQMSMESLRDESRTGDGADNSDEARAERTRQLKTLRAKIASKATPASARPVGPVVATATLGGGNDE